eukprot:scaffold109619_cov54-Phaeocystis_antarctica.AAC.1
MVARSKKVSSPPTSRPPPSPRRRAWLGLGLGLGLARARARVRIRVRVRMIGGVLGRAQLRRRRVRRGLPLGLETHLVG